MRVLVASDLYIFWAFYFLAGLQGCRNVEVLRVLMLTGAAADWLTIMPTGTCIFDEK
jgi:hypothetical protein